MIQHGFDWAAFLVFAAVSSFTPGPNVILLAGSGSAWGFRRTVPHLLGVIFGFPLMLLLVQFGAAEAFERAPWLLTALTVFSLAYTVWLAVRIFKMGSESRFEARASERPLTFTEAVLFQWVNGKAWQMVLVVATLYATDSLRLRLLGALAFVAILMVTGSIWVELGKRIGEYLARPAARRAYYTALATGLLLATVPGAVSMLLSRAALPRSGSGAVASVRTIPLTR